MVIGGVGVIGACLLLAFVGEPGQPSTYASVGQTDESSAVQNDATSYHSISDTEEEQTRAPLAPAKLSVMETLALIASDKPVLLLFIAAPLRFLGGFAIGTFLPQYYNRRFPEYSSAYSTLNALIVSLGGVSSAYLGGAATDRLRSRDRRAPAIVPALSSFFGLIPFFGVMYADDFGTSIFCLFLEYLIAESWFGSALSIMQERVPANARGVTISIYLFISGLVGSVAPALLGHLDDGTSYESLQKNIMLFVSISYLGTSLVFVAIMYQIGSPVASLE